MYWSQTGNTQARAEAVGAGITKAGKEADVVEVSGASMEDLKAAKVFALGCPAMGAEVLEEMEMEPFVEEVEGFAQGKTIALFGSYGWGDGQWMSCLLYTSKNDFSHDEVFLVDTLKDHMAYRLWQQKQSRMQFGEKLTVSAEMCIRARN